MKVTKAQLRQIIKEVVSHSDRDELLNKIESEFKINARTTEEFGGSPGGIWLSGESGEEASDGLRLFDYYSDDRGPYTFGVHKEIEEFIDPFGFYAEWYDPGTIMLWRK